MDLTLVCRCWYGGERWKRREEVRHALVAERNGRGRGLGERERRGEMTEPNEYGCVVNVIHECKAGSLF